ncbi:MAG: Endoglucanase precursor [Acidimicrobiales bacterium]|jgi:endoglucanase|nr:Endoglucanase precursor [Acidimicrobiales bacterium]
MSHHSISVRRPRKLALALVAALLATVSPLLASLGGGGARASAAPAFTATSGTIEAENLNGTFTRVSDTSATGEHAVIVQGATWLLTGMPAGAYTLTARVKSINARMNVVLANSRVGEFGVAGGWQSISVPVYVSANGLQLGVVPTAPLYGMTAQPLYLDWFAIAPASSGFTTSGNTILDGNGKGFIPRGVNRNGLELTPTGYGMSFWDFGWMYNWGASSVRLQLTEVFWLSGSCHFDPAYAGRVDTAVKQITSLGMMAVLDLHTSMGAATPCDVTTPVNDYRMADGQSVNFWQQVAARYKSNPLVAFDLYNEPRDITPNVWRNGGMVNGWKAVGMQTLYNAVRSTGATNLTFVSGTNWGHDLSSVLWQPIDGYGIVYSSHQYNDYACGPIAADTDKVVTPVAAKYPVSLNEFGTQCDSPDYNANVIAYAESHGIGWMAFAWNDNGPKAWSLLTAFDTHAPSPAGLPVRDALWAARGWTSYGGA